MLWVKKLQGKRMVYIDILKHENFDRDKSEFEMVMDLLKSEQLNTSHKNDEMATLYRQHANNLFVQDNNFEEAIIKYNKAIFAAVPRSENLGMSYANRAACFLHLKKYTLCLSDIELAKKNGYPARLWPKLDERKAKCLELMHSRNGQEPYHVGATLNFPPDKQTPCFAEGIEITRASNGNSHIVTKRNLEIGDTVIIEKAYEMVSENPYNYRSCSNCFKTDANLRPCPKCVRVMYCSQECFDAGHKKFHKVECDINYRFLLWESSQRLVFRTILLAIRTFGTVEALIEAIESFHREKKIDETDPAKRDYFKFFASIREIEKLSQETESKFRSLVLRMQTIIMNESILSSQFISVRQQRFLGHLIMHHLYVINRNSFTAASFVEFTYKAELGPFNTAISTIYHGTADVVGATPLERNAYSASLANFYGRGIALDGMHMNHSCVPNVARLFVDNKIIYRAIRPIKSGEELFVSYLHPIVLMESTRNRAERLSVDYPLKCQCSSCKSKLPPYQSTGVTDIDKSLRQLLSLLQKLPKKFVDRRMSVDRPKLAKLESSIIQHLRRTDNIHPTEATMKLQFLLMQIWNTQYAVNVQ